MTALQSEHIYATAMQAAQRLEDATDQSTGPEALEAAEQQAQYLRGRRISYLGIWRAGLFAIMSIAITIAFRLSGALQVIAVVVAACALAGIYAIRRTWRRTAEGEALARVERAMTRYAGLRPERSE
jgi:uncharacterized membrane protein